MSDSERKPTPEEIINKKTRPSANNAGIEWKGEDLKQGTSIIYNKRGGSGWVDGLVSQVNEDNTVQIWIFENRQFDTVDPNLMRHDLRYLKDAHVEWDILAQGEGPEGGALPAKVVSINSDHTINIDVGGTLFENVKREMLKPRNINRPKSEKKLEENLAKLMRSSDGKGETSVASINTGMHVEWSPEAILIAFYAKHKPDIANMKNVSKITAAFKEIMASKRDAPQAAAPAEAEAKAAAAAAEQKAAEEIPKDFDELGGGGKKSKKKSRRKFKKKSSRRKSKKKSKRKSKKR